MRPVTALPFTAHARVFTVLACGTLPPLRDKIDVGRESYAIFVGGSGIGGDLYAVRADGGPAYQITYTTVPELRPALSPDGAQVAFFRGLSLRDSTPASVWVLNLLNGADRELRLPKDAGLPERIGWSSDGKTLLVKTSQSLYRAGGSTGQAQSEERPARGTCSGGVESRRASGRSGLCPRRSLSPKGRPLRHPPQRPSRYFGSGSKRSGALGQ